jgi:hypothetical protein
MVEDAGCAQALALLRELYDQVDDVSRKIEVAERRGCRASIRGAAQDRRHQSALRRELYEVHRLIDALHTRYPQTAPWPERTAVG